MLYGFILLLCFADGAEIADQPDVVLYAAVDKSAFQKNQNKADVVAEAVPEKKGLFFHSLSLSLFYYFSGFFLASFFIYFLQFNKYRIVYQKYIVLCCFLNQFKILVILSPIDLRTKCVADYFTE